LISMRRALLKVHSRYAKKTDVLNQISIYLNTR
jgi:hypothetical protein